jgi:DNA replication initiation complex subunit (GINS family)
MIWKNIILGFCTIFNKNYQKITSLSNVGLDERFNEENTTYQEEQLYKIHLNFIKKDLISLLENKNISNYEKIKALDNYNLKYENKSCFSKDLTKYLYTTYF